MKKLLYLILFITSGALAQGGSTTTLPTGTSPVTPSFRYKPVTPDSLNRLFMFNPITGKYNEMYTATKTLSVFAKKDTVTYDIRNFPQYGRLSATGNNTALFDSVIAHIPQGGRLLIPEGVWRGNIDINRDNITILGSKPPTYVHGAQPVGTVIIGGVTFAGSHGIEIANIATYQVAISGTNANGFQGGSNRTNDNEIMNQYVHDCVTIGDSSINNSQHAFLFQGGKGFRVERCYADNYNHGYAMRCSDFIVNDCYATRMDSEAFLAKSGTSGVANNCYNGTFNNCRGENNLVHFFVYDEAGGTFVKNIRITNCSGSISGSDGVEIGGTTGIDGVSIANVLIDGAHGAAFEIDNCTNTNFANVIAVNTTGYGFRNTLGTNCSVTNATSSNASAADYLGTYNLLIINGHTFIQDLTIGVNDAFGVTSHDGNITSHSENNGTAAGPIWRMDMNVGSGPQNSVIAEIKGYGHRTAFTNSLDFIIGAWANSNSATDTIMRLTRSNVEINGTLTLPGSSSQYVKGDGSLGTYSGGTVTSVTSANSDLGVANTTTTPVITLNNINGTTKTYYDPTSSIQTQLNSKVGITGTETISGKKTFTDTLTAAILKGDATAFLTLKPNAAATSANSFILDNNGLTYGGASVAGSVFLSRRTIANPSVSNISLRAVDTYTATTGSNSNALQGINVGVTIGAGNTQNWTGSIIGISGSASVASGATGILTKFIGLQGIIANGSAGTTITNAVGVIANSKNSVVGTTTNATDILYGSLTPVTGDWGLYNAGGRNNYLGTGKTSVGTFQVGTSTTAGNVLTADASGNATWQAPTGTNIVSSGDLQSQTTDGLIFSTYSVGASDASFQVSTALLINSVTTNTIRIGIDYTDETNTSAHYDFYPGGSNTKDVGIVGRYSFPTSGEIRCKAGTTISVYTAYVVSAGSMDFNVHASLIKLR